jgi:hypothetical protein
MLQSTVAYYVMWCPCVHTSITSPILWIKTYHITVVYITPHTLNNFKFHYFIIIHSYSLSFFFFFFLRRYNFREVLAFPTSSFHLERFLLQFFQFVIFIFVMSLFTSSSHLFFGLPSDLVNAGDHSYTFFYHAVIWHAMHISKPSQSLCFDVIYDIFVTTLFNSSFLFSINLHYYSKVKSFNRNYMVLILWSDSNTCNNCILVSKASPWRWPDYRPKHVGEDINNTTS